MCVDNSTNTKMNRNEEKAHLSVTHLVGDFFEVLSISEPGRDVSRSRQTFQISDEHVKSWSPLDMDSFKVHQVFEHEEYSLKIHSWRCGQYQPIITLSRI